MSSEAHDTTGFLYEIGLLKRYPSTGWALAGVPVAESVAEHSFRASVIAAVIAAAEDAEDAEPRSSRFGTTPRRPAPPTCPT
jgi:putative hydrolases of HD superfamily